jgi:hypothetical protein
MKHNKNTRSSWTGFLFLAGIFLLPTGLTAQSASDIMRRAVEAQEERLAGVENVTLVQEVMGMETSMYMEKRDMGGTSVLFPVSVSMGGMTQAVPQDAGQADWASPFQEAWIERARLVGQEELDGRQVQVLTIDDFSGLELPSVPSSTEGSGSLRPISIRFWMDTDDYLTRKVSAELEGTGSDGEPTTVHMEMFLEDYREVDGYIHPFVTRTVMEGMMEAADLDRDEVRAQLDQMRAQLESMPEAQRAMMEGMMGSQIERLEGMLEGDGSMEMTITVKEIRVNSGAPGGE